MYDIALLYAKAGNTHNANEYRQKHCELKAEIENRHATELEELQAELLKQQSESEKRVLSLKDSLRNEAQLKSNAIGYLLALVTLVAFAVVYQHGRGMYRELSKRTLINELLLKTSGNPEAKHTELFDKVEQVNRQFLMVLCYRYKDLKRQLREDYPNFSKDYAGSCSSTCYRSMMLLCSWALMMAALPI